jgi:hypothetical protein
MSLPTVMITSEKATRKSMTRPSLSLPNAPLTTLDASGPSGTTTATSASFAFSPNETGSKFECSLDGAPFAECASPKEPHLDRLGDAVNLRRQDGHGQRQRG